MIGGSVSAQSLKPAVTEFSLQYVDNSYDIPPSYTSTKDLYTGEVTTSTIPGYHVENKSIVATIRNPLGVNAYNFRWKAHNDNLWNYEPFNTDADHTTPLSVADSYGVQAYASDLENTVISLTFIPKSITSVDVQVQALYGDYRADPYVHVMLTGGPTYDFYFDGQASYWSNTQTISSVSISTSPSPTVSSTPNIPEFQSLIILIMLSIMVAIAGLLVYFKKRKH
jgi:hypothetical protein